MAENPTAKATDIASEPAAESSDETRLHADNTQITAGAPVIVAAPHDVGETTVPSLPHGPTLNYVR